MIFFFYIHERFRKLGIAKFYCPSLQPHKFIYFWCFWGRSEGGRREGGVETLGAGKRVLKVPLKSSESISSGTKRCYSFDYSPGSVAGAAAGRAGAASQLSRCFISKLTEA